MTEVTGVVHDPCLCDTFIAAVRFMEGGPSRPWWYYTARAQAANLRWRVSAAALGLRIVPVHSARAAAAFPDLLQARRVRLGRGTMP